MVHEATSHQNSVFFFFLTVHGHALGHAGAGEGPRGATVSGRFGLVHTTRN